MVDSRVLGWRRSVAEMKSFEMSGKGNVLTIDAKGARKVQPWDGLMAVN